MSCICQEQHRRGYCTEPGCPYAMDESLRPKPVMENLRPCPFCGSAPSVSSRMDEDLATHNIVKWHVVGCYECGISFEMPDGYEDNPFDQWNKRTPDRDPAQEVSGPDPLRVAMAHACDLLAERVYGHPARSAGHNARLILEAALDAHPQKVEAEDDFSVGVERLAAMTRPQKVRPTNSDGGVEVDTQPNPEAGLAAGEESACLGGDECSRAVSGSALSTRAGVTPSPSETAPQKVSYADAPRDGREVLFEHTFRLRGYWDEHLKRFVMTYPLNMDYVPNSATYLPLPDHPPRSQEEGA